jgi:hypothetical protein
LEILTSIAFLGPNDILVTKKNTSKVMRVTNGTALSQAVIDVPVLTAIERELGIVISIQQAGKTCDFLFYTESEYIQDNSDVDSFVEPLGWIISI